MVNRKCTISWLSRHFNEAEQQTHAGYDNLSELSNPAISFLQAALTDLTAEYAALSQMQLAQRYRIDLTANHKGAF